MNERKHILVRSKSADVQHVRPVSLKSMEGFGEVRGVKLCEHGIGGLCDDG